MNCHFHNHMEDTGTISKPGVLFSQNFHDNDESRKNTYALVVGIEKYQFGKKHDLEGPVKDARAFADWLWAQGVPPENIFLFLAPADQDTSLPAGNGPVPQPATREKIRDT